MSIGLWSFQLGYLKLVRFLYNKTEKAFSPTLPESLLKMIIINLTDINYINTENPLWRKFGQSLMTILTIPNDYFFPKQLYLLHRLHPFIIDDQQQSLWWNDSDQPPEKKAITRATVDYVRQLKKGSWQLKIFFCI